ncbi:RNA-directed DNA polymerase, eukaryota [Tanacetum coccineum]
MPSFRSKEDHVNNISKSVFVTNFPDSVGSRELWKLCQAYDTVVDVFIPNRKSKAGKRFAFVRFIKDSKGPFGKESSDDFSPALVLDDSCIYNVDLSRHVMGRVKELSSIPNLRFILTKEGFMEVQLSYIGGLWVLIELKSVIIQSKFLHHTGVKSWFHELQAATHDFICNERIVWVDIEGEVFLVRAKKLFTWTPCFLEFKDPGYNSDDDSVLGVQNSLDKSQQGNTLHSENHVDTEVDPSLSYPPGFTPAGTNQESQANDSSSAFSTHVHSRVSLKGGSFLDVLDDIIQVGRSMGYEIEGCSNDIEHIIGLKGVDGVLMGNSNFQFVASGSVGNSGSILCVWEESVFIKDDASISDNFIALYGTWLPTNSKILIVVIYAPQSFALKRCFPRGGNSSFIALIPKVLDAKFVTDFHPISLIGSVYKVVTKILASRLALVISDLISNT